MVMVVRPNVVLAICCTSILIVSLDATVMNVALPAIRADLGAKTSGLQWVLDAYTLVVASLLMLSGSLADRFGRKRTFQLGMILFTLASLLCSLSPNLESLILFRMIQGIGASMLNPVAMSIVVNTFEDPNQRARAIGFWGAVLGVSMALGPLVGGGLTQTSGWRSIFWINLPIGLASVLLTQRFIPESRATRARRIDPVGQVLVFTALASFTYAVIEGRHRGWGSVTITGLFAVALASVVGLLVYEPRQAEPLIELRFFRSIPFASATVLAVANFASFAGFLFLNALYLQEVRGIPAFWTGVYTMPLALMQIVCSPISGRLVGRYGVRVPLVGAGIAITVAALLLTRLDERTSLAYLLVSYVVFGIGIGLVNPPITNSAVSGMPRARAGLASAIASTSRQVGASFGVALAGAIVSGAGHHVSAPDFVASSHAFWWLVAIAGVVIAALGILASGAWARASVAGIAVLLAEEPVPTAAAEAR